MLCRLSGILSAYGMGLADVVKEQQLPCAVQLTADTIPGLASKLASLADSVRLELLRQSFAEDAISVSLFVHLRCVSAFHRSLFAAMRTLLVSPSYLPSPPLALTQFALPASPLHVCA